MNRPVSALAVKGARVYAGGVFTRAGGERHNYVALIDAATGVVDHSFDAGTDLPVALAASDGRLYLGGEFGTVNGEVRSRLARVDDTKGELDPSWKPAADGAVRTLELSPDGVRLYAGGIHHHLRKNQAESRGPGGVHWRPRHDLAARLPGRPVYDVEATDTRVYVAGGGTGESGGIPCLHRRAPLEPQGRR